MKSLKSERNPLLSKIIAFWHWLNSKRFFIALISGAKAGVIGGSLIGLTLGIHFFLVDSIPLRESYVDIGQFCLLGTFFGTIISTLLALILAFIVKEAFLVRTSQVIGILIGGLFGLFAINDNHEYAIIGWLVATLNIYWSIYASSYGANSYLHHFRKK
jgi:hypothetical protein